MNLDIVASNDRFTSAIGIHAFRSLQMVRADAWSDDEIILAIAACPREKQSYSPRHKNVIELADLIGRSRGAVSLHFANVSNLIFGGDHGKTHVGRRTRELFEEYRNREGELQEKAAEIRRRLMQNDLTPRVEREVPEDEARKLIEEIIDEARRAGLPEDGAVTYERKGSWYVGVLMPLESVLPQFKESGTVFARALVERFDHGWVRSRGLEFAARGEWQYLVDAQLAIDVPLLHQEELSPSDRTTLLTRLREIGSLKHWGRERGLERSVPVGRRELLFRELSARLGIDTSRLCDDCLLMLNDLTEDREQTAENDDTESSSRE